MQEFNLDDDMVHISSFFQKEKNDKPNQNEIGGTKTCSGDSGSEARALDGPLTFLRVE